MCPHCGHVVAVAGRASMELEPPPLPPPSSLPAAEPEVVAEPPPLPGPPPPPPSKWPLVLYILGGLLLLGAIVELFRLMQDSAPAPAPPPAVQAPTEQAAGPAPVSAAEPASEPTESAPAKPEPTSVPTIAVKTANRRDDSALARIRPVAPKQAERALTDERIGEAIRRGVAWLITDLPQIRAEAARAASDDPKDIDRKAVAEGTLALSAYALLHAGQAVDDERLGIRSAFIKELLVDLKACKMQTSKATYARSLRIAALTVYNRADDHRAIEEDVNWLVSNRIRFSDEDLRQGDAASRAAHGAYTYGRVGYPAVAGQRWDNSNAQYGALGVWLAEDSGFDVPVQYWKDVVGHWTACQLSSGGWGYSPSAPELRPTMSCAGAMCLFVAREKLSDHPEDLRDVQPGLDQAIARALDWLETEDHSVRIDGGYALYGLERLGLTSGIKYFGSHDWYTELATRTVRDQQQEGAAETAFKLLFLARGRHPSFIAKASMGNNDASWGRDVASLTKFASKQLERPLNYQMVSLARGWLDWTDSPVLFLSADRALELNERERNKLKDFALGGGMLFTQAEGGRAEVTESIKALAKELFPDYSLDALPENHPIYTVVFPMREHPPLLGLSNGARLLMVHSPSDLAVTWQRGNERAGRAAFELGVNVVMYATGKREFRNRLDELRIAGPREKAAGQIAVARLRYDGNWDPEPVAWHQMDWLLQNQTGVGMDVQTIDISRLGVSSPPLAHLTGTSSYAFSENEVSAVRKYVETGGVLLIDTCGGSRAFLKSVQTGLLSRAFPEAAAGAIPRNHPLLMPRDEAAQLPAACAGLMDDLSRPALRMFALEGWAEDEPTLEMLDVGRGHVLLSHVDIVSGLVGTRSWGIAGYSASYSQSLVKNLLLWRIGVAQQGQQVQGKR